MVDVGSGADRPHNALEMSGLGFSPRRGLHKPAQGKAKRRQPRRVALGKQVHRNRALKGRNITRPEQSTEAKTRGTTVRECFAHARTNHPDSGQRSLTVASLKYTRANRCTALSGLRCGVATSTQGGAALCPGLTCSCPFGAIVVSTFQGFVLGGLAYFSKPSVPAPSRRNQLDPVDFRPSPWDNRDPPGAVPGPAE